MVKTADGKVNIVPYPEISIDLEIDGKNVKIFRYAEEEELHKNDDGSYHVDFAKGTCLLITFD